MPAFNKYYSLYTEEGDHLMVWGGPDGGIYFRVNNGLHVGSIHSLDDDDSLQIRVTTTILKYYKSLKKGITP